MKPFYGWLNSFFFFLTGNWSIITGYVSQKWHCGASSCKEKEHGETHSCLWRNCHELLWWSYAWMSGSCRTCLWTCSGENFHYMGEIEWVEMFFSHATRAGSNSVQAWIFFRPYFHYCLRILHYWKDRFHIHVIIIIVIYYYIKPFISASSMLFNMILQRSSCISSFLYFCLLFRERVNTHLLKNWKTLSQSLS